MKTVKALLWFIVPMVLIVFALALLLNRTLSSSFFGNRHLMLRLLLEDSIFLKALFNTFLCPALTCLVTGAALYGIRLLTHRLTRRHIDRRIFFPASFIVITGAACLAEVLRMRSLSKALFIFPPVPTRPTLSITLLLTFMLFSLCALLLIWTVEKLALLIYRSLRHSL